MILFLSCNQDDHDLYSFDPRILEEKSVLLSDIADDITFIPFDNSVPLDLIYSDILFCRNSIYLSTKDNGILAFSRSGKFIRPIGTKGRGPGEYTYCYDLAIDEDKEIIYTIDNRIIKVYSGTGRFIRSFSVEDIGSIDNIDFIDSKLFVIFDMSDALNMNDAKTELAWLALDSLCKIVWKQERRLPGFEANYGFGSGTYRFMNQLFYWNFFTDTVYSILPDFTETPSFVIKAGDHRLPKGRINSLAVLEGKLIVKNVFETKRFLVIRYSFNKPTLVLIEKENYGHFLSYMSGDDGGLFEWNLTGGITDDLSGGPAFLPHSSFEENGVEYMFGLIDPWEIKSHVDSPDFKNVKPIFPEKKKELKNLAASLKETDNPVLVLVRLKN